VGVLFNDTGVPMFGMIALLATAALVSFVAIRPPSTAAAS
jgi:hypothetical protein